jgi:hypothetical protein
MTVADACNLAHPQERGNNDARIDVLEAWQRDVLTELRAIRVALELRRPSPLTRADRDRLATLLPAVGGVYGSEPFSSRDLVEDSRPAVRLVVRGLGAKQIGRLCARADGIPIDGLMVQKQGVEFQVTLWRIVRV